MSKGARIAVIVFSVLAAVVLLMAAVAAYWWSRHGEEMVEAGKQAASRGAEFGATTDSAGCLQESLARHDACDGFFCHVANNLFLRACLEKGAATEGFCDGVPATDSIVESARWRAAQCAAHGRSGSYCPELFAQVQAHCAGGSGSD